MKAILRIARTVVVLHALLAASAVLAWTQGPVHVSPGAPAETSTVLVLAFENSSKVAGIEWISEAFPELLDREALVGLALRHQPRRPHVRL
jgi:hypothetical protein